MFGRHVDTMAPIAEGLNSFVWSQTAIIVQNYGSQPNTFTNMGYGLVGFRPLGLVDLHRRSYMNQRGWRPTI